VCVCDMFHGVVEVVKGALKLKICVSIVCDVTCHLSVFPLMLVNSWY